MNELYHHGILGQKWGVRRYRNKDGSLTSAGKKRYGDTATKYTESQYMRDKKVYGSIAARRINRNMLKGSSVSGERSREADRIANARQKAGTSGKIGGTVGKIAGGLAGGLASVSAIRKFSNISPDTVLSQPAMQGLIVSGSMAVGSILGGALGKKAASSISMVSRGYSPRKKRE